MDVLRRLGGRGERCASWVIAIDGKTVRRSGHKRGGKAAIHMVSAFAAGQRLVLGQVKVAEKSDEIRAIPKLLDMLAIEVAIITIDAMGKAGQRFRQAQPDGMARRGCQRDIARKIIDKKADYVLALKGNQGSLREDVEVFVAEQEAVRFKDAKSARTGRSTAITTASRPASPR
jgi:predicted transposase YbfD/YdcC